MQVIYGIHPILESLRAGGEGIETIILARGKAGGALGEIITLAEKKDIEIKYSDRNVLDKLAMGKRHQGIVCICKEFSYTNLDDVISGCRGSDKGGLIGCGEIGPDVPIENVDAQQSGYLDIVDSHPQYDHRQKRGERGRRSNRGAHFHQQPLSFEFAGCFSDAASRAQIGAARDADPVADAEDGVAFRAPFLGEILGA